jgi:hypothetical protein
VLEQLRMPGPWNEIKPLTATPANAVPVSWRDFKDDVEHERGLFKILALYVVDKFNKKETRTLKSYLEVEESRSLEAGLDLATVLFDAGVVSPLVGLLGVPTLAVAVALVGIRYGYRTLTDPNVGRMGDGNS